MPTERAPFKCQACGHEATVVVTTEPGRSAHPEFAVVCDVCKKENLSLAPPGQRVTSTRLEPKP
jgi:transcription elongation factor Elf1